MKFRLLLLLTFLSITASAQRTWTSFGSNGVQRSVTNPPSSAPDTLFRSNGGASGFVYWRSDYWNQRNLGLFSFEASQKQRAWQGIAVNDDKIYVFSDRDSVFNLENIIQVYNKNGILLQQKHSAYTGLDSSGRFMSFGSSAYFDGSSFYYPVYNTNSGSAPSPYQAKIVKFNASTLAFEADYPIGTGTAEGIWKYGNDYFVCYDNFMKIRRFNSSFVFQQEYNLSRPLKPDGGYQSIFFIGNKVYMNYHGSNLYGNTYAPGMDEYTYNGTTFTFVATHTPPTYGSGQGVAYDGKHYYWNDRSANRIVRTSYLGERSLEYNNPNFGFTNMQNILISQDVTQQRDDGYVAKIIGNAKITGNLAVGSNLSVSGGQTVSGNSDVSAYGSYGNMLSIYGWGSGSGSSALRMGWDGSYIRYSGYNYNTSTFLPVLFQGASFEFNSNLLVTGYMRASINDGAPTSVVRNSDLSAYEVSSNKSTSTSLGTSNTLYPTQNAVKTYVDGQIGGVSTTYVPYTGAANNLNLGTFTISAAIVNGQTNVGAAINGQGTGSNTAINANNSSTGNGLSASAVSGKSIDAANSSNTNATIAVANNGTGRLATFSQGATLKASIENDGTVIAPLLGFTKTLTSSGTGVATTISIAHGLTGITSASAIIASANSADAAGYNYVDITSTVVNFYYTVAPIVGTNNLKYSVTIK